MLRPRPSGWTGAKTGATIAEIDETIGVPVAKIDVTTGGLPTGAYLVSLRPEATQRSYGELRADLGSALAAATDDPASGVVRR